MWNLFVCLDCYSGISVFACLIGLLVGLFWSGLVCGQSILQVQSLTAESATAAATAAAAAAAAAAACCELW